MQLRLSDVMQGPFVALPLDQVCEADGSIKISIANVFGKPDSQVPDEPIEFHSPEPVVVTQAQEAPKVTTGQVVPPWELAASNAGQGKTVETQPEEPVKEEAAVTDGLAVPWEKPVSSLAEVVAVAQEFEKKDRGLPEGWGMDPAQSQVEINNYTFASNQDESDWILAKGRALPYSMREDNRPDPFFVPEMYKMVEQRRQSHLIGCTVTNFRAACRHAIAMSILYHDQDIERFESAQRAQQEAMQSDEAQAAHIRWKQAIEKRKQVVKELDKEVADARDAWHALRK